MSYCAGQKTRKVFQHIRKGSRFTDHEDSMIIDCFINNRSKEHILQVARSLSSTPAMMKQRYENGLNPTLKRGEWDREEDQAILDFFESEKHSQRGQLKNLLPGRNAKQIRQRYSVLKVCNQSEWTLEENCLLEQLYEQKGPHWGEIAKYFQERKPNSVKCHYLQLQKRNKKKLEKMKSFEFARSEIITLIPKPKEYLEFVLEKQVIFEGNL